jgi:hypothetical protein
MSSPICTVAIPVYNRISFLDEAIASVLNQNVADLEILVVDDGSKPEISRQLDDLVRPGVTLVRNPQNLGLFGNWNRCLELAQGIFFKILCSDDFLEPGTLAREIAFCRQHPQVGMVSTRGVSVDSQGRQLGRIGDVIPAGVYDGESALHRLFHFYYGTGINPFNYPSGILFRTECVRQVGGFDTSMQHVGDLDLFYKLLRCSQLGVMPHVGCRITLHEGQAGVQQSTQTWGVEENFVILKRHKECLAPAEYRRLVRLQVGLTMWFGVKFLFQRKGEAFLRYFRVARSHGQSLLVLGVGFAHFAVLKVLLSKRPPTLRPVQSG